MSSSDCILIIFAAVVLCTAASSAVLPLDKPAMGIRVEAGEYRILGRSVTVTTTVELPVDPPERLRTPAEEVVLTDDKPKAYQGGAVLRKTLGPVDRCTRMPKMIDPASVRVHSTWDGGTVYREGTDYFLDHEWGGLSRIETGTIPAGAKVYVDYAVLRQRIDSVQVSRMGVVLLKKGKPVAANPEIPKPDTGCTILANIYVPFRTTTITAENIYPLPAEEITWRNFIKTSGREHLGRTLSLLKAGQPVTIVCWGDSVTQGGSPSSHDKCYVELFRARLKAAYPKAEINVINAGIGGSNTNSRRDGYEKDVLALNPDLITAEYVNDVGMTPDMIGANYEEFISRARRRNPRVEFIILTPHFTMPEWMGNFGNSVPAMRRAAEENGVALGDTANIWGNLRKVGIPYEALEANGINHPNDLGHEFFAETLMRLLSPARS